MLPEAFMSLLKPCSTLGTWEEGRGLFSEAWCPAPTACPVKSGKLMAADPATLL